MFFWTLNIKAISQHLPEMLSWPFKPPVVTDKKRMSFPTLFIKGEKSGYINDSDLFTIKQIFPKAELVTIFDAGHWLHAEKAEAFLKTVKNFLDEDNIGG